MKENSQEKKAAPVKKINAYGEATSREITCATYERAKAREQKKFDNWFGAAFLR